VNYLFVCAMALLFAIEISDEEREQVEEYRKSIIASVNAELRGLQKDLKEATLARDKKRVDEIKTAIAWRKKRVNDTRKYDAEDLFAGMVNERNAKAAKALEIEQWKQDEKVMAAAGPVSIRGMGINTNVIGLPELTLDVQNNTNTTVEAIEFEADCFNKFDEPVIGLASGNRFSSHWKYAIPPGGRKQMSAQMSLFRTTAKADVWISRVKLGSGEVWTQTKDEAKKTPYGLAKARLME
jgi:hypothetical protein